MTGSPLYGATSVHDALVFSSPVSFYGLSFMRRVYTARHASESTLPNLFKRTVDLAVGCRSCPALSILPWAVDLALRCRSCPTLSILPCAVDLALCCQSCHGLSILPCPHPLQAAAWNPCHAIRTVTCCTVMNDKAYPAKVCMLVRVHHAHKTSCHVPGV
jgi:hypothetical protein